MGHHRIPLSWDQVHMRMATDASERSKNLGDRFGAVVVSAENVVVASGFNGPPALFDDAALDWESPDAKLLHLHAESNALWHATMSRGWVGLAGCRLYCTGRPCARCCLEMVRARIKECVFGSWQVATMSTGDDWARAMATMKMGQVKWRALE